MPTLFSLLRAQTLTLFCYENCCCCVTKTVVVLLRKLMLFCYENCCCCVTKPVVVLLRKLLLLCYENWLCFVTKNWCGHWWVTRVRFCPAMVLVVGKHTGRHFQASPGGHLSLANHDYCKRCAPWCPVHGCYMPILQAKDASAQSRL